MEFECDEFSVEQDILLNRRLCMQLLHLLEKALMTLNEQHDDDERPPCPWVAQLFGSKEGLAGAYIRLSQQQLRIASLQVKITAPAVQSAVHPELKEEDIPMLRRFLETLEHA